AGGPGRQRSGGPAPYRFPPRNCAITLPGGGEVGSAVATTGTRQHFRRYSPCLPLPGQHRSPLDPTADRTGPHAAAPPPGPGPPPPPTTPALLREPAPAAAAIPPTPTASDSSTARSGCAAR